MNIQIIKGRLTTNPEQRITQNGITLTTFCVAVDRDYTSKDEKKQVDFFNCIAWRGTADFVSTYFTKGQEIIISGTMQCRNYTDKNDIKRYIWELICDKVSFCGSKSQNASVDIKENNTFQEMPDNTELPF